MIQEAKNRQARYDDTKNNFFNTLTSGYQAFQGAMKQPSNPFGGPPPPHASNFGGQGGYGAPGGYGAQSGYGAQGGYGAQSGYGAGFGVSNFGAAPYGGAGYGQQLPQGQNPQFNNMYPAFPQFPGQNYPQPGNFGNSQHRGY